MVKCRQRPCWVVAKQTTLPLDRAFFALADGTRRAIIERLVKGDANLSEIAKPFPMSLVAVQKHVRVLEDAGLVATRKRGRSRHVRLRAAPMKEAVDYLHKYRVFWEERLDGLADLLEDGPEDASKEEDP